MLLSLLLFSIILKVEAIGSLDNIFQIICVLVVISYLHLIFTPFFWFVNVFRYVFTVIFLWLLGCLSLRVDSYVIINEEKAEGFEVLHKNHDYLTVPIYILQSSVIRGKNSERKLSNHNECQWNIWNYHDKMHWNNCNSFASAILCSSIRLAFLHCEKKIIFD